MSGLPDVGLLTAPASIGAMRIGSNVLVVPPGAVVAGHNHQGVLVHAQCVHRIQNAADHRVHLGHVIAIQTGARFALVLRERNPRRVRRGHGEVEEERLLLVLCALVQNFDCLIGERGQHLRDVEVRGAQARPPVVAVRCIRAGFMNRRQLYRVLVFKIEVRLHIERRGNPEVIIESVRVRSRR